MKRVEAFRSLRVVTRFRDEWPMTSLVMVRLLCVVLCFAGLATAQEPPPLEPPDLGPPRAGAPQAQPGTTSKPASPKPTAPTQPRATQAVNSRPASGPMLAIPGVTAPTARPRPQPASPLQSGTSPFSSPIASPPVRSAVPVTRRPSPANGIPPLEALSGPSPRETIPLSIEPLIDVPSPEQARASTSLPRPVASRALGAGRTDPPSQEKASSAPRPAPDDCPACSVASSGRRHRHPRANRREPPPERPTVVKPMSCPMPNLSPNGGSSARSARPSATGSITSRFASPAGMR